MAGENTVSTLNGLFKDVFADKIDDLVPETAWLQTEASGVLFGQAEKQGELYSVPTVLRSNQGVSYLGSAGGVSQLNAVANAVMKEAQVKGSEVNVRGQLSYSAASRASSQGPKAFKKASAWLVEDLAKVAHNRLEISALYGQSGIGTVSAQNDAGGGSATITISAETFAPGIWIALEGALIETFTGTSANSVTTITVNSVNTATRVVSVTYTGSWDVVANDECYPKDAYDAGSTWNEMIGLYKQATDASSTLFGIDRSAYTLAQGNTFSSTGALTKAKILDATSKLVDKGLMGDIVALVSPKAWSVLAAEEMALRVFDSSYSKAKSQSGSREIAFEYAAGGSVKVVAHAFVKQGHCFLFSPKKIEWVGSSKPTFTLPGKDAEFFQFVNDYNAYELQNYADLAIFLHAPACAGVMTGITYS